MLDLRQGDCLDVMRTLSSGSVNCIVTSPPYFGLRDYGVDGQIGLEQSPDVYVAALVSVFREARRVLADDGTLWLNIGDSYAGNAGGRQGATGDRATRTFTGEMRGARKGAKPKDLLMIPARVALALQADGWYLRSEIIWAKPNPMPESVRDRPTNAHEKVFFFAKSARYFYDAEAVREDAVGQNHHDLTGGRYAPPGQTDHTGSRENSARSIDGKRNMRNVWTITPKPFKGAHFAVFPPALVEPCIKAGCPVGGTVLDPFFGAGTTGLVAQALGRDCIGIELSPDYLAIARERLGVPVLHAAE